MSERVEKFSELIKRLSANFLEEASNRDALVSVMRVELSPDLKRGTVFITVLPTSKEESVMNFVKRKRSDLRDYFKKNLKTKTIPFVDIQIDLGEKARQNIEDLLRQTKKMK